jgi:hypothetical protein
VRLCVCKYHYPFFSAVHHLSPLKENWYKYDQTSDLDCPLPAHSGNQRVNDRLDRIRLEFPENRNAQFFILVLMFGISGSTLLCSSYSGTIVLTQINVRGLRLKKLTIGIDSLTLWRNCWRAQEIWVPFFSNEHSIGVPTRGHLREFVVTTRGCLAVCSADSRAKPADLEARPGG